MTRCKIYTLLCILASASLAGCADEAFCYNCDGPPADTDAGAESSLADGSGFDGISTDGSWLDTSNTCEDTQSDPMNCGACGNVCEQKTGTLVTCQQGKCVSECAVGWVNLDNDLAKNGCEYHCTRTNGAVEICDGKDNDCNGVTDEGFDISKDVQNCGKCGNTCLFSNAKSQCIQGVCTIAECLPGWQDSKTNTDPDCDYACSPTNNGVEICDGVDNDCNGVADDGVDTSSDVQNCGKCGQSCLNLFPFATANCEQGLCVMDACEAGHFDHNQNDADGCEWTCESNCNSFPFATGVCDPQGGCTMGDCLPNYFNHDNDPANGCEYFCIVTNAGKEVCDLVDNDCNGLVDDQPDTSTDPLNCGQCGKSCGGAFPNATPLCQSGACVLGSCFPGYFDKDGDPANGCEYSCESTCAFPFATGTCQADGTCVFDKCLLNFHDLDGDTSNGCEYACAPTNNGVEVCDGKDNDCDGAADDGFNLNTDPLNCGQCGKDCHVWFPHSTVACQVVANTPTCVWTGCEPGFNNDDGQPNNGCEYACTKTNGGVEICDGVDNDCDGLADNPPGGVFNPPLTELCPADDPKDVCVSKTVCVAGVPKCVQQIGPADEICNGKDDDCDGTTDEDPDGAGPLNLPQVGFACGTSQVGACKFGVTACVAGAISCQGAVHAKTETCNGIDDNCNGVVDDNPQGQGQSCDLVPGSTGACTPGTRQCISGGFVCTGGVGPATEVCDGPRGTTNDQFDNDCDGAIDESCVFSYEPPLRLDTGTTVGQSSSFQLDTASTGDEFMAVWSDMRTGNPNIMGRASANAGASWGPELSIATLAESEVEPSVMMRSGRAFVVYSLFMGNVRRIHGRYSTAPYTTWSGYVKIDAASSSDATIDSYAPSGVVAKADSGANTNDWLAVVWSDIAGSQFNPTRNIRVSFSKVGGAFWSLPLQVNTGAGADKGELPVIATDGNGVVHLAWRDKRAAGLAQVWYARLDLNAATPALSNVRALQPSVSGASAEEIVIAADAANNVHVAWTDLRATNKAVRVASSADGGVNWRQVGGQVDGAVINADATFASASSPTIAARDGRVVVAWEDTRSGASDIRVNHSDDAGATWQTSSARADTGDGMGATSSFFPQVAMGQGDNVFVTWQDLRFPATAVIASTSIDRGSTFHASAGTAFRMDIDTTTSPVGGATADSQSPWVLASPTTHSASVLWIDFRNASGGNGQNGDIWTRRLAP